ncbi:MAG TPA: hypothetical protein VGQ08_09455 [Nitrospiraceae bacterium]|jgi:hypothetical protein|nr:hypothetical protein [Nitrospiraceae bacterium]
MKDGGKFQAQRVNPRGLPRWHIVGGRRRTAQLVRQAVSDGRRAYVLVNNRSEGNAPLTVQALAEMLRD